jgi:hypothetical protein
MIGAEPVDITRELARGKFTDEMLNDMRARIGLELRTDACVNNEDATLEDADWSVPLPSASMTPSATLGRCAVG